MPQPYTPPGASRPYSIPNRLTDSTDVEQWFKDVVDDIETYLALMATRDTAVITGNSANPALKVTQAGAGLVALFEDQASDGSPVAIDTAGNVGIGILPVNKLHLSADAAGGADIRTDTNSSDANGGGFYFVKRRGTAASPLIVASGDTIGNIQFFGHDGTTTREAARITGFVNGTPGASDMPGGLLFLTTLDGASTPTERMRLNHAGRLALGSTVTNVAQFLIQESGLAQLAFNNAAGTTKSYIGTIGAIGAAGTDDLRIRSDGTTIHMGINGASSFQIQASGIYGPGLLQTGLGVSTTDVQFEHGAGRSGDGNTYIDLHATAGTDYELRLVRNAGVNGVGALAHKGTGAFSIKTEDAADLNFFTSNVQRLGLSLNGVLTFMNDTAAPDFSIRNRSVAGYSPALVRLSRQGAAGIATPNGSQIGELRFDGMDASGTPAYVVFASIQAAIGTNVAGGAPSYLAFSTAPSGGPATERMRINDLGNVGIGTTTPSVYGLSVAKATAVAAGIRITSGATHGEVVMHDGQALYITNTSATLPTSFWLNGAERMLITSGGSVGIGATPSASFKLDVNGGARSLDVSIAKTASFTLASADWGKRIDCSHPSTQINVTLPKDATDNAPVNAWWDVVRTGVAVVQIQAEDGTVTIDYDTTAGLKIRGLNTSVTITKTASNRYLVRGDISA